MKTTTIFLIAAATVAAFSFPVYAKGSKPHVAPTSLNCSIGAADELDGCPSPTPNHYSAPSVGGIPGSSGPSGTVCTGNVCRVYDMDYQGWHYHDNGGGNWTVSNGSSSYSYQYHSDGSYTRTP